MNRRGFIRTLAGGVAAALGMSMAPKNKSPWGLGIPRLITESPYICTMKKVRYRYEDGLYQDVVVIDDVPNPAYDGDPWWVIMKMLAQQRGMHLEFRKALHFGPPVES